MFSNNYRFLTRWRVLGTARAVYEILSNPEDYQHWWPEVFLSLHVVDRDQRGKPRGLVIHSKGWLPYTLRWQAQLVRKEAGQGFALKADGDFAGRGTFSMKQDGPWVDITYDWRVAARKPLLRYLSWLLKPLFAANHRWAMRRGERALQLELLRRRQEIPEIERGPVRKQHRSGLELLPL